MLLGFSCFAFEQWVTRAFHVYDYSTYGSTQKDLVMRVLTAKEVNFVSGGSIDGNQYSNPWVLSGDDQSSGSCSSSSSDASCSVSSSSSVSQSFCQTPSVDGGNGGYLGTGMPCTSGNSVGDVNYSPPTQEEACSNAADLKDYGLVTAAGALIPGAQGVAVPLSVSLQGLGGALSLLNGCN